MKKYRKPTSSPNNVDKLHLLKVAGLFVFFCILAYLFLIIRPGWYIWPILVLSAIVWLFIELTGKLRSKEEVKSAFFLGLFLMIFDFIVENLGGYFGYWKVNTTLFHVGYVPIEVMLLTLIGGMAWALAQPRAYSVKNSLADILLFAVFGAIGESVLRFNGVMFYASGWTHFHAFAGYAITWIILHYLRYKYRNGY